MAVLVNPDQTCGVKGRAGSFNLLLIRDIISWVEERDLPLCILSLDQEKAFDRVNHEFLFKVSEKMNVGERFISWVRVFYNKVYSRVKINGFLSEPIEQRGGVRQGCPLSPLLYVLFIEPLAERTRNEQNIEGVHIPGGLGERVKVSQYADDTTVFISTDCTNIGNVLCSYWLGHKPCQIIINVLWEMERKERGEARFFGVSYGNQNFGG